MIERFRKFGRSTSKLKRSWRSENKSDSLQNTQLDDTGRGMSGNICHPEGCLWKNNNNQFRGMFFVVDIFWKLQSTLFTKKEFRICILQSIIYQYYKLKLQCTVYSAALHGCTALHCFLSFQVSLQCDSHFSHDWAPQESLKSSSGDSLGSHRYKRPAKARRPAIWLAYIQAAVGSGPVEHLGAIGIDPKGPSHSACISFWIPKRQAISTDTSFETKMMVKSGLFSNPMSPFRVPC